MLSQQQHPLKRELQLSESRFNEIIRENFLGNRVPPRQKFVTQVIHEVQNTLDWLFMLGCFGLIALGTGGIKPNIANFGADQIGDETEKQRESQKTFFSLFYLSINIGVLNLSFVRIKRVKRNEQLFFWPCFFFEEEKWRR